MKTFGISLKLCTNYNICILFLGGRSSGGFCWWWRLYSSCRPLKLLSSDITRQGCQRGSQPANQAGIQADPFVAGRESVFSRVAPLVSVGTRPISCFDLKLNVWETGGYVNIGVFSATPFLNISHNHPPAIAQRRIVVIPGPEEEG